MKYNEWTEKNIVERATWKKTSPRLSESEAQKIVNEVVDLRLSVGDMIVALRQRGIWISDTRGIEDFSVDAWPTYMGEGGKMRKLKW